MFNFQKKRNLLLEVNDYMIRTISLNGTDWSQAKMTETPLNHGVVEEGILRDEMALYEVFKKNVQLWGGKRQNVRFFVPNSSVMMKSFEHPSDVPSSKLKGYVQMELGQSIHLPFQNPLIDVYDHLKNDGVGTLFAAPSEEVMKLMGLCDDVSLHPEIADIRALSNIRFLSNVMPSLKAKTYLIADWSISELNITIYSKGDIEFMRFQTIETNAKKWRTRLSDNEELDVVYDGDLTEYEAQLIDPMEEIGRILNFYRFSLNKGEKQVDELIVMGDSPLLGHIGATLKQQYELPITIIDDEMVAKSFPQFKAKHAALVGLAMKEA